MKKLISIVLGAVMGLSLAACGGSSASSAASAKEYNLDDIVSAVEAVNPVSNPREVDDFALENEFMLSADDVVSYKGELSNDQGNSAQIMAVQCADGKADDVKKALETYQQNQVAYYGNYAEFADGQALIKDGRIVEKGDYVVLVFANTDGASYTDIDNALSSALD